MEISKKLEKKINTITQLKGERPKEIEITKEESIELVRENMKAKEQFLTIKNNDVYFCNVKLKIKE